MSDDRVPNPGAQGTFGVGAIRDDGGIHLWTVGSNDFHNKVATVTGEKAGQGIAVASNDLGARDAGVHGEVELIKANPDVQAIRTTQDCCLFCYGLVAKRGYNHQKLRPNVWPQMWEHPSLDFKLYKRVAYLAANRASVVITWQDQTAYYALGE